MHTTDELPTQTEVDSILDYWLQALRSGDYSQADGTLHQIKERDLDGGYIPAGYCCLGVLCDVCVKKELDLAWPIGSAGNSDEEWEFLVLSSTADAKSSVTLPGSSWLSRALNFRIGDKYANAFMTEFGDLDPAICVKETISQVRFLELLIGLNDNHHSFSTIADVIEFSRPYIYRHLEGLSQ